MGVLGYSTTAASNTTALAGVGSLAEGVMPIKQINDAFRQEIADTAQMYADVVTGITTTGTSSAYVVATASGHATYNNQMALRLRFHLDCAGGATTVNVNVLGTKALKVFDTSGARDPVAGEIKADMVYDCVYVTALNCMIVTAHTSPNYTTLLTAKQPLDATLTSLSGLTIAAGTTLYGTGAETLAALAPGTSRQALRMNSGGTAPEWVTDTIWTYTAPVSLTGLSTNDWTGIPAGVTEVKVFLSLVSLSGTNNIDVLLGTAGGMVATGYYSLTSTVDGTAVATSSSTVSFLLFAGIAADAMSGFLSFTKGDSNKWFLSATVARGGAKMTISAGEVDLGAALTQLRVKTAGANTFDGSSSAYIAYR